MRVLLLALLLFSADSIAIDAVNSYELYLIRHAEKQPDGSRDPVLTEVGKQRSVQLAQWFQDKKLKDIWSSDYYRTRDTATPLLLQTGLKLSLYDPGDQTALVKNLLDRKHNALVIGHSNTIPALARLLCQCTIADMSEAEHDRLIVITVADGVRTVRTLWQKRLFLP